AIFIAQVKELLEHLKGQCMPFRDIRQNLMFLFGNFNLTVFQYGQKESYEEFVNSVSLLPSSVKLFIALGMESKIRNSFVAVAPNGLSVGECFFPLFLAQEAGSILLGKKHAAKLSPNSLRFIIYNSMHHQRKHLSYLLDFKHRDEENDTYYELDSDDT